VLKRDAPFRGGFEGLLFFWLGWLRLSSVEGAPLALRYTLNRGITKMKNISIKGIVIAVIVALILDIIGGIAGIPLFAESMTEEAILAVEKQTNFLLYSLVIGSLTTVLGGYISAKYGKLAPYKNSVIFGLIGVIIGLMLATFDPLWFDIIGFISLIPASVLGAYFIASKSA
jgi:hypothetical protein